MTQFEITVAGNHARLTATRGIPTAGMTGASAAVTFDAAWAGLQPVAVFRCGSATVDVPMESAVVPIPGHILQPDETLHLGIYGTDGEATVLPTVWVALATVAPGADPNLVAEPQVRYWENIQTQLGDLDDLTTENRENLVAAINEAAAGPDLTGLELTPIVSKNLFNPAACSPTGQWVNYLSGIREFYPDNPYIQPRFTSEDIPIQGARTYVYTGGSWDPWKTMLNSYAIFTAAGEFLQGAVTTDHDRFQPLLITTPERAGYIVLNMDEVHQTETIQLELGSQPTAYEPYGIRGAKLTGVKVPHTGIFYEGTGLLQLPPKYDLVVGDAFELFYKGILLCHDTDAYLVRITCDMGSAYREKFTVTPDSPGSHTLTAEVYDSLGNLLDKATTQLEVAEKKTSVPAENILCLGDSLTAGGVWVQELHRRLTANNAVAANGDAAPGGDGLTGITFVGKKKTQSGAGYEGTGGWRYSHYLDGTNAENPFAYNGSVDFAAYCQELGIAKIDRCFILLGWNMAGYTEEAWKNDARSLIRKLLESNSGMRITLLGLQIPSRDGLGANYGASGIYSDYRGLQQYVFRVDRWNRDLAAEFPANVTAVSIAGQFDTDHNMPAAQAPVNLRSQVKESRQNNGVHPAVPGYYQIADAAWRHYHGG